MMRDGERTVEIRPFTEADRAGLTELFGRAGEGSPVASLWGHTPSEAAIYLEPYMDSEPESLLLAVVDGVPQGYLAGCRDTGAFPSEDARIAAAIRRYRLVFRRGPAAFFARATLDALTAKLRGRPAAGEIEDARYPAHLHIAVSPALRGTGAADALMRHWLGLLRAGGSPGCHLQTQVENARAVRFFRRMGFTEYGATPVIPGLRHAGRHVHQQTMVWTPAATR